MPCAVCRDLGICNWANFYVAEQEEPTLSMDIERSAAAGDCRYCSMLHRGIAYLYPDNRPEAFYFWREEDACMALYFAPHDLSAVYEFHTIPKSNIKSMNFVAPSFPISGDAAAEECIRFARSALSVCLEKHHECARPIRQRPGSNKIMQRLQSGIRKPFHNRPRLPTRVLDVGSSGSDEVRLVEKRHKRAMYACLSHCWGAVQPLKTEMSTLEARRASIAWSALPKTFQDAVDFTRRLGIRYLWIDSLCIVQDSKDDWRREASRMASIYENCFVCLAATTSSGHQQGLYFEQPNPCASTKVLDLVENGETYEIFVRSALPHSADYTQSGSGYQYPLLQRGWVFQEMLLAPRIVHFFKNELYIQCMKSQTCECGRGSGSTRSYVSKAKHFEALSSADTSAVQKRWRDMIAHYSKLRLTYANDKLPALAGLARQMMPFRKGRYLAGLWEDSLLEDLRWNTTSMRPEPSESYIAPSWSYIAPSWSWASVSGSVSFYAEMTDIEFRSKFVPDAQIIMVEVNTIGNDPTGQVSSGFLQLSAAWTRKNPTGNGPQSLEGGLGDEDLYYLAIGHDQYFRRTYWLVLERLTSEPPRYQRWDFLIEAYRNLEANVEERKVFTIV